MDYEEACETMVSVPQAIAELEGHGVIADYDGDGLFDCATAETIAPICGGLVSGGAVLAYLGY